MQVLPWALGMMAMGVLPACSATIESKAEAGLLGEAEAVVERARVELQSSTEITLAPEIVAGSGADATDADPPDDYLRMTATARSGDAFGHVVLLADAEQQVFVPIFIGGTEALSIRLRLERRRFKRPLTHDLLDRMLDELGVEVLRAQVDGLRDNIYLGTVVVKKGQTVMRFDARPSDAIAIAIGNGAPIYVSEKLVAKAGVRRDQLDQKRADSKVDPVAL